MVVATQTRRRETPMSHYQHLTISERESIWENKLAGKSLREIARQTGRSVSTISRELKRNGTSQKYRPSEAQKKYERRRKRCRRKKLLQEGELKDLVVRLLTQQQWSPEQIAQRIELERGKKLVSYATIYRALHKGLMESKGTRKNRHGRYPMEKHLRRKGWRGKGKGQKSRHFVHQTIEERPEEANRRSEIGHWEGDLVYSSFYKLYVVTLVERLSHNLCKPAERCRIEAADRRLLHMARKNRTPEENARREKIRELLQVANIGSMDDIQNLFKETIAEFMENGLEAELDEDLGYSRYDYKNKATDNSRNGHSSKTLRTSFGDVEVSVPRDRKGEFDPQVLKKGQTSISQDVEEKILSMYAKGMTTSDIEAHIQDIYGISVSDSTISRITEKILPIAKEWQQRPLESIYAVVFLDAIHYHVRSEGQIVKKAVYIAIGVILDGRKDVLGMWVGENESAKFWATVLNGLKNRGVEDIFIACTDNLTGFDAAIHAVFPKTEIQNCIIHQLRNSSKYVSYKDLKALMADLKAVYAAVDEQAALDALDVFGEHWDKKYPKISKSWRDNWANLSTYFKYPQEVRRLIYTTNTIEGFNRQLRKVTKSKSVFPTDDSLLKMLYLAMMDITKKWTGRRQDWSMIHAQMAIYFAGHMPE